MSCRQIEKIVKENTEGTAARGKKKDTEPEPVDEPEEEPADNATLLIEWDDLPEEIAEYLSKEFELDGVDRIEITL